MTKYFACAALCLAVASNVNAADWPQILGPDRNGVSRETGLLNAWPASGPREVWRTPGGVGMSGIVVSGGHVITLAHRDGKQQVICLNAKTGKPLWQTPVAREYRNGQGNGPRATPAIAGGSVFVFTGEGVLAALKLADGKPLWSKNVVAENGGKVADYGMACSPLVTGKNVVVTIGAPRATFAAYDTATGNQTWKAGKGEAAGYSSPALLTVRGREHIVATTGAAVTGIAPAAGSILWRYPYKTDYNCNIATPLAIDGKVFISAGESHGSVLLKLTPSAGGFTAAPAWESLGVKSVLRCEWQTPVLIDGYLYGFDNVGSAGAISHFTCIKASTGERMWQQLRFGKGNLIAADGKLLMTTMKGELVLAKASPESYQEISRKRVAGTTRQAPTLANGLLYMRDGKDIICFNVHE